MFRNRSVKGGKAFAAAMAELSASGTLPVRSGSQSVEGSAHGGRTSFRAVASAALAAVRLERSVHGGELVRGEGSRRGVGEGSQRSGGEGAGEEVVRAAGEEAGARSAGEEAGARAAGEEVVSLLWLAWPALDRSCGQPVTWG